MLFMIAAAEGDAAAAGAFWGFLGIAIAMALCSKSCSNQTWVQPTELQRVALESPQWEFSNQT